MKKHYFLLLTFIFSSTLVAAEKNYYELAHKFGLKRSHYSSEWAFKNAVEQEEKKQERAAIEAQEEAEREDEKAQQDASRILKQLIVVGTILGAATYYVKDGVIAWWKQQWRTDEQAATPETQRTASEIARNPAAAIPQTPILDNVNWIAYETQKPSAGYSSSEEYPRN